jgi:protein-tyrosine phosphatase
MDSDNILDLERRFGTRPKMSRILDYAKNTDLRDVPDPYYEGNFEDVYQMIADGCRGLLETIKKEQGF